ncbi:hypothetical protein [Nonomuraea sp. NPDC049141]|uniref:hypothetical protein n=1 Tax=Nonomuraea sp. NPDC049141 TaxID=3155500 RepID=UPI0033E3ED8A
MCRSRRRSSGCWSTCASATIWRCCSSPTTSGWCTRSRTASPSCRGVVVEEGRTTDVLGAPRHEYTRSLLDAALELSTTDAQDG